MSFTRATAICIRWCCSTTKVAGELEKAEQLAGDILKMCVDLGGSITGEHGVGVEKLAYMPYQFNERDLELDVRHLPQFRS